MSIINKFVILASMCWLIVSQVSSAEISSVAENSAVEESAANSFAPPRYGFSLAPYIGLLAGQAEEIVYKYSGEKQYYSQLLWDLKPLAYVGFSAHFGPRDPFRSKGIVAEVSFRYGLPFKTGVMEDRDWADKNENFLTHYSKHDAYSQNAILLDVSAGYSWRLNHFLSIGASGEISFMNFSWMAENGYANYMAEIPPEGSELYDPDQIIPYKFVGPGIAYMQNWLIFSPVVFLKGRISRFFSAEGSISYSPLILFSGRDDHFARNVIFRDYCYFGHYVNGGLVFTYSPTAKIDISLSLSYRFITGVRGISYIEYTGANVTKSGGKSEKDSGAGYSVFNAGIFAKFYIF
jgi:outer membrane protease